MWLKLTRDGQKELINMALVYNIDARPEGGSTLYFNDRNSFDSIDVDESFDDLAQVLGALSK